MTVLTPTAKMQFLDITGAPLVGGKVYTYVAGTTTPLTTYSDSAGSSANPNPVILDARGEANIWLSADTYKFKLTDSSDVEIWTVDNISAPTTALSPVLSGNVTINSDSSAAALTITQTGTGAVMRVQDSTNPDATPFIIDTNGNIGAGTPSPTAKIDVADGNIVLSTLAGSIYTTISATLTDSIIAAENDRNLVIKTNNVARLTVNSTAITTTVPVVLPSNPTTSLQAATKGYVDLGAPAGLIAPFAGSTAPAGWLVCDGSPVSRTLYATLFAAIGSGAVWGNGDGASTFNVPDLRGVFLRGTGINATGASAGATGPNIGTYAADTYLNHSHTATSTDSGHTHSIPNIADPGSVAGGGSFRNAAGTSGVGTANITTTVAASTTGGTETKPKNYGILYIIKT